MDRRNHTMAAEEQSMRTEPRVLVIAGSDSSGGAGIARDVAVLTGLGVHASIAITAVTAQTHERVAAVGPMTPALVSAQMEAALEAGPVGAIKIGMLATRGTVEAVAAVLRKHDRIPVVLDPVLVSSSGGRLLERDAVAALKLDLLPLCRLVTPNWPELAALTDQEPARNEKEALDQGDLLLASGCGALLVKGGHAPDGEKSVDILLGRGHVPVRFEAPRLDVSMRGTGCALASSIAGGVARGLPLEDSIVFGKQNVYHILDAASRTHHQQGDLTHKRAPQA